MRDDVPYLRHILECIRRIEENVAGGRERFLASHTVQDAVLRNLQTMAESTQRLSNAQKTMYPEIEWRRIRTQEMNRFLKGARRYENKNWH